MNPKTEEAATAKLRVVVESLNRCPLLLCAENPRGYSTLLDWLNDKTPVLTVVIK